MKQILSAAVFVFAVMSPASFANAQAGSVTAGCQPSDFVSGTTHIGINGTGYTPKCLRVKAGSTVTIDATSNHPLQGIETTGATNPIFDEFGGAVTLKTVVFQEVGLFAYFCVAHGDDTGAGMAGAILVEQ